MGYALSARCISVFPTVNLSGHDPQDLFFLSNQTFPETLLKKGVEQ
jgi:hypothetical protein